MLFVNIFFSHWKYYKEWYNWKYYNEWYTQSCLQKCLSFQYEPNKGLPVQIQLLE